MHRPRALVLTLALILLGGTALAQGTLRIGLNEDPDALDPARGGTFVGRIVFAAVCDKLIDTDAANNFVPQLATAWTWSPDNLALTLALRDGVRFQDGAPMDAEAVRANLERYRTAPESVRKSELKPVSAVEVIDPHTVRLRVAQPYAPLVAVLADRVGIMISPASLGGDVSQKLPCAGPFKLTERVAQDRIVVDRFPEYWNAAAIHLNRIVYHPQPDTSIRLVNLEAGQLDMVERLGPTDAATVRKNPKLKLVGQTALAYYSISINLANKGPLSELLVREALESAIDRSALSQVVTDGQFIPSNQFEAPDSRYWDPGRPVPARDVARAKALMQQAGVPHPAFTLLVGNSSVEQQAGEVLQSMANEAGFAMKIQAVEANAQVAAARAGNYDATVVIWSGRPDPDGNVAIWLQCDGFLNWGKYCNPAFDALLAKARGVTDVAARQAAYRQVVDVYLHDRPHIVRMPCKMAVGAERQGIRLRADAGRADSAAGHGGVAMTRIDGTRLLRDLQTLRSIGAYRTGVHRPTYSPADIEARHWLAARLTEAGLDAEIDGIGNVVGRGPAEGPFLLIGSHLETQSHAGWLDGAMGVIYGLEVARALGRGVDVVAWADEEGHFGSFLGSRSFCGLVDEAELDACRNRTEGTSLREALQRAGLSGRPRTVLDPARYRGYLEAHIEQGDELDTSGRRLGVVTSIVGARNYRITFEGVQNHAGTTRMAIRRDAGVALVRLADAIDRRFPQIAGPRTVWTVGRITLEPGAPSIVPGRAEMLFQFRDTDPAVLDRLAQALEALVAKAAQGPCRITLEALSRSVPTVMDGGFRDALERAAERHAPGLVAQLPSGAGHDAQILAARLPAAMLFVPSIGGISHHWTEDTSEADIVLGCDVLADAAVDILGLMSSGTKSEL